MWTTLTVPHSNVTTKQTENLYQLATENHEMIWELQFLAENYSHDVNIKANSTPETLFCEPKKRVVQKDRQTPFHSVIESSAIAQ